MATLRIDVLEERDGVLSTATTRTFSTFPVRIGREGADCLVPYSFVSRSHARIELEAGRLFLRDGGSTHGTFLDGRRLALDERVELPSDGAHFGIGPVRLMATLVATTLAASRFDTADARAPDEGATRRYREAQVDPAAVDSAASRAELETTDVAAQTPSAELALRGINELLARYVPYAPPLSTPETVARFLEKLDAALEVFFDAFASLRFAYRTETGRGDSAPALRVDVGARLLDWTDSSNEARALLEDECFAMMAHHLRVRELGAKRAERILAALAPEAVEARCTKRVGRSRAVWEAYRALHAEVAGSERASERHEPTVLVASDAALGT